MALLRHFSLGALCTNARCDLLLLASPLRPSVVHGSYRLSRCQPSFLLHRLHPHHPPLCTIATVCSCVCVCLCMASLEAVLALALLRGSVVIRRVRYSSTPSRPPPRQHQAQRAACRATRGGWGTCAHGRLRLRPRLGVGGSGRSRGAVAVDAIEGALDVSRGQGRPQLLALLP